MPEQTLTINGSVLGLTGLGATGIYTQISPIDSLHDVIFAAAEVNLNVQILEPVNCIFPVIAQKITNQKKATLIPDGSICQLLSLYPYLTTGGGVHYNTMPVLYSGQDYLKCRHLQGTLTGYYTSPIFNIGAEASNRHIVYIVGEDSVEADIVIVGEGTTWDDKFPSPTKWSEANVSTLTWSEIFNLSSAPSVRMRLYYGTSSPPTNYIDRMEILSAIIPANNQYFQVKVTITDPNINVFAYVEAFVLKFCTYS